MGFQAAALRGGLAEWRRATTKEVAPVRG